ncbi:hypothetical protein DPSP01_014376 [Paraphaeosphaeria sporulosa]
MRSALILAAFALTAFTAPLPVDEAQGNTINERKVRLNSRDAEADPEISFYNKREPEPANVRFNNKREPEPANVRFNHKREAEPANVRFNNKREAEPANVRFNNKREAEPANVRFNNKREEEVEAEAEINTRSSDGFEDTAKLDFVE